MATKNSVSLHVALEAKQARESIKALNTQLNEVAQKQYTIEIKLKGATPATINKRADALKNLADQIQVITGQSSQAMTNVQALGEVTKQLGTNANNAKKGLTGLGSSLDNAKKKSQQLTQAEKERNAAIAEGNRILSRAQSIITGFAVGAYVAGIRSALVELRNVDTELVTIQKVTGQTRQEVQALADESYTTAAKYGAIASDYLSSVASFARAGYQENAKALGELSLMTQKVGDVDAKTADQFLLSVDAAYQYKGSIQELTKVLDGANEIGNKFATDVNKITAGLGIVSNVAKQANVDIDEVTAALGTITATTQRSGSEAARALRAILLNIAADVSTEIDEDTGDHWTAEEVEAMATSLQKFGIYTRYVKDGMEQLRNPMEVIGEIAEKVKSGMISEVELNDLLQGLGGKLRSNQLLALINNWDMYTSMLNTYRTAAGSAEEELGIYLDSWEAKAAKLQATWTELVNKTLNSDTIKNILDFANAFLKASDSLGLLTATLGGFLTLINANKIANIWNGVSSIGSSIGSVLSGGGMSLVGGIGTIGLLVTAITSLVIAYRMARDAYMENTKASLEDAGAKAEQNQKAIELHASFQKLVAVSDQTETSQENIRERAYEVAEAYGIEKSRVDALAESTHNYAAALEEAVIQKRLLDSAEYEQNVDNYIDALRGRGGEFLLSRMSQTVSVQGENGESIDFLRDYNNTSDTEFIATYQNATQETERLYNQMAELARMGLTNSDAYKYLKNEYKEVSDVLRELDPQIHDLAMGFMDSKRSVYEMKFGLIDTKKEAYDFVDAVIKEEGATGEFANGLATALMLLFDFKDGTEETGDALDDLKPKAEETTKIFGDLSDSFSDLQSKYNSLIEIAESYNKTGELTAEQFKTITDSGLLPYLEFVDGQLRINEAALLDNADAAKANALEQLRAAYAADLLALQEGRVADMSAGAQGAISSVGGTAEGAGNKALNAAAKWTALGSAINYAAEAAMGDGAHSVEYWMQGNTDDKLNEYYNKARDAILALNFDTSGGGGGGGGGGGSSRSSAATEKANTYIEVLKAMLDDADFQVEQWTRDGGKEDAIIAMYERMMREIESVREKYLAEGYDETSDEVQELTKLWWKYADAIEDIHDDIAKQVQNTWDELDNAIDAEIDALKEARDIEEEQLDLEEKRLAVLEAEQALLDARNDRSVRKYNADGSWEWVADERNIQSAQEAYDKARETYDKALQDKEYADLEAEWEAIKKAIEDPGRDIAEILNDIETIGTPAMKKQVDNITSLLGKMGYNIAVVGAAKSGGVTSSDSAQINKLLTGDYSGATFDNGGVAGIKGIMLKNTQDAETVLPPSLTKAIISPQRNAQFSTFTDALTKMFGMAEYRASGAGTITRNYGNTDSHDTTYTVNGVQIGWAQAQRPFYEVMRDIVVYTNPN